LPLLAEFGIDVDSELRFFAKRWSARFALFFARDRPEAFQLYGTL
jgi:hypothetical protein